MKVAIVGSKDYLRQDFVEYFMQILPKITKIVVTGMKGPSMWAEELARLTNMPRPIVFPIPKGDFERDEFIEHCKNRNLKLVKEADLVVCFWAGDDPNTKEVIRLMTVEGKASFSIPAAMKDQEAKYLMSYIIDMIEVKHLTEANNANSPT